MPDGWLEACRISENRLRDITPIDAINASMCLETECPAAQVLDMTTPFGTTRMVYCIFSKCIHRYPTKKEMRLMK